MLSFKIILFEFSPAVLILCVVIHHTDFYYSSLKITRQTNYCEKGVGIPSAKTILQIEAFTVIKREAARLCDKTLPVLNELVV
jgi:hypothetical protein